LYEIRIAKARRRSGRLSLAESAAKYSGPHLFKDRQSRFILINPAMARLFGLPSPEDAIGKTDFDIFTREHATAALADEQAILRTGQPIVAKLEKETWPDGTVSWVTTTKLALRNQEGEIVGTFGISRDTTERRRAEEALRQAVEDLQKSREKLKDAHQQLMRAERLETVGRMAAGVAHEVQNPLQILLMSLDYLAQRLPDRDPVLDDVLNEMRNAAKRADTIIRGLLDFSRSDDLELKAQDLNTLVENALLQVKHALTHHHVGLQTQLALKLPPLALDGMKIEQVFVNLFTNAIHAMPEGGSLTVKTRAERLTETHRDLGLREAGHFYAGDTVVIVEIDDTGRGIPPGVLRKIFDPFFTTKATGKGTGLGLAIVKRIIDLHSGEIEINNRPEGGAHCRLMFKAHAKMEDQPPA
jgi:PAS domain S-box-containing protein